eukprot:scaffold9249_cov151-Skeletonema_menzelii.AAC.4
MKDNKRSAESMTGSGRATITRLVCRRQWGQLCELLQQGDGIPIDDASGHSITSDLLVHFVCRFQAPTSIVRLVAKTYQESIKCADALGRFPIHVSQTYLLKYLYRLKYYTHNIPECVHSRSLALGEHLQKLLNF